MHGYRQFLSSPDNTGVYLVSDRGHDHGVLMRYLKPTIHVIAAILFVAIGIADCQARGRTDSHRIGGYNSHGKGSHYVGGH
jgi:hypothetical protein